MLKKMLLIILFSFLLNPILVSSVDVTSCKSGTLNWLCERGRTCVCEISGTCSNGNFLVYDEYLTNPLCSPQIIDDTATIDWTYCNSTKDYVKARADCDEGQSPEKMIIITAPTGTTTTSIMTTTTLYGGCGMDGYCEYGENECLEGYEDCPEYDFECSTGEKCCCFVSVGTTTTQKKPSGFNYGWLIIPILIIIGVFVYFFFIRKERRRREYIEKFRKLYEKWTR